MKLDKSIVGFFYFLFFMVFIFSLSGNSLVHRVAKGDTLYNVSKRYGVSIESIITENRLASSGAIKIGQELIIRGAKVAERGSEKGTIIPQTPKQNGWVQYKIEKGDTLYSLARRYEVELKKLMGENNLKEGAVIRPEQILWVPSPTLALVPENTDEKKDIKWNEISFEKKGEKVQEGQLLWPAVGTLLRRTGKIEGIVIESEFGSPVVSISSGTVVWAASFRGFQKMVVVQTPSGYNYTYCGNDKIFVKVGDSVSVGMQIGTVGYSSYHDKVPNVLLMTYKGEKLIDPVKAPRQ